VLALLNACFLSDRLAYDRSWPGSSHARKSDFCVGWNSIRAPRVDRCNFFLREPCADYRAQRRGWWRVAGGSSRSGSRTSRSAAPDPNDGRADEFAPLHPQFAVVRTVWSCAGLRLSRLCPVSRRGEPITVAASSGVIRPSASAVSTA
jgi:hypothetical protein